LAKYCPGCGRSMPDDGNNCPYCGKLVAMHEGIKVQTPQGASKKDNSKLIVIIIVVILVLAIVITVAIAATVYVYVSGMTGPMDGIQRTPNLAIRVSSDSGNNATMFINHVDADDVDVLWSDITFTIYDKTDSNSLDENIDFTVDISDSNIGLVDVSDYVKFSGIGVEFQEYHEYRLSLIYVGTGELISVYSWEQ